MPAFARRAAIIFAIIALGSPRAIFAHAFGQSYVLPVPLWMYAYGAIAALVLSFIVIGYLSGDAEPPKTEGRAIEGWGIIRFFRSAFFVGFLRMLTVTLLLLSITSGFIGANSPIANVNMTLFWIVFLLGMTYLVAILGDVWQSMNPWRALVRWYADTGSKRPPRFSYPEKLGVWPALLAYVGLIWFELIGIPTPFLLSIALVSYTAYTFLGAYLFGEEAWFSKADFFTVFFGIVARLAPIKIENGAVRLRVPFAGLIERGAGSMAELCFILFMIASTSFDGFQETLPMLKLYLNTFSLIPSYDLFRTVSFVLAPILFLAGYMLCSWAVQRLVRSTLSVKDIALRFAYTLVPIALAYNIAHYYTLLLVQGQDVIRLISDPFGFGWNLFGTAGYSVNVGIVQAGFVWHSQVAALLIGHIASVYLAHVASVRLFASRRKAVLSQLPMLILMVAFTVLGLWILSQPITSG